MTLLLDLAIRSAILVLVGLAAAAVLRKQSAALRHAVLAMTIVGAAALLPLTAVVPAWQVPLPAFFGPPVATPQAWGSPSPPSAAPHVGVPPASNDPGPRTIEGSVAAARPAISFVQFAGVIWSVGFAVCVTALLTGFVRLAGIARRAERVRGGEWVRAAGRLEAAYRLRRPVILLQTDAPDVLATFGMRQHRVLLPVHASEWTPERIHAVLSHELAHVRRQDWLVQMGAEALRCVYWFNPLMWIACARLRRESECACDDVVLRRGMVPRDYAGHLLELARACRRPRRHVPLPAIPMARATTLERRITLMLNPAVNRTSVSSRARVTAAALLACLSLSVAAVRAGHSASLIPSATDARGGVTGAAPALPDTSGQSAQSAPLFGSIYDASGAVLPGVDVTLRDAQQATQTAVTDASGRFQFPSVAPGTYVLEAALRGFRKVRQNVELRAAGDWDRVITLQLGQVSEKIVVNAPRATTPARVPQVQPTRLVVGGNVRPPRKVKDVKPVYPASMREAGLEAVVSLDAVIGTDGSVTSVRVVSADVHPDFAIAAAEAVRQWKFDPTLLNGAAVEVQMTVSVEFTLSR